MKKIEINALSKTYNVLLESGILNEAGAHILEALHLDSGKGKKICVVTDKTVNGLYADDNQPLMKSLKASGFEVHKYVFPGGEDYKTLSTVEGILDYLIDNHFNRGDYLVAFGGGITGDLTGFTAAIYMRGIKYIQIPTTLLSSVDSSVGGKTGANLKAGKNLTGAFWQPELVLFDPDVLSTLEYVQLLDGMAEMLKAGMISDESLVYHIISCGKSEASDFADTMSISAGYGNNDIPQIFNDKDALLEAIAKSIDIKREIVEDDEREQGRRKLLNYGHTIAHSIEKFTNYEISHGIAVAIGMCIAQTASEKMGWVCEPSADVLKAIVKYFKYPVPDFQTDDLAKKLAEAALNDKKAGSNSVSIIYADKPGCCVSKNVEFKDLKDFISSGL